MIIHSQSFLFFSLLNISGRRPGKYFFSSTSAFLLVGMLIFLSVILKRWSHEIWKVQGKQKPFFSCYSGLYIGFGKHGFCRVFCFPLLVICLRDAKDSWSLLQFFDLFMIAETPILSILWQKTSKN